MKYFHPVILSLALYSCSTGNVGKRKKMPEQRDEQSFEGVPAFQSGAPQSTYSNGFQSADYNVAMANIPEGYLYIPLPDPAGDSMTIAMLRGYKANALPFLQNWAKEHSQGVAIDLAAHNGTALHRAVYTLQKQEEFSIPVILIWDEETAGRLETLKELAAEIPSVNLFKASK